MCTIQLPLIWTWAGRRQGEAPRSPINGSSFTGNGPAPSVPFLLSARVDGVALTFSDENFIVDTLRRGEIYTHERTHASEKGSIR